MNTVISSLDSPARASSCAVTPAATRWVISPLMITMRARNSRSAMRLYGGATDTSRGVNSSIGSPGLVANRRVRDLGRGPPALSQLRKRPRDVHPRHLLSPGQIEVGVVHRLRGAVCRVRRGRNRLVRQGGSGERRARRGDLLRPARDPAEHDPRLHPPLPAPCSHLVHAATPSTGKSNDPRRRSLWYTASQPSGAGSRTVARISSGCCVT